VPQKVVVVVVVVVVVEIKGKREKSGEFKS